MAGNSNSGRHKSISPIAAEKLGKLYQHAWNVIERAICPTEDDPISKLRLETAWNIIWQRDGKPRQQLLHSGDPEGKPIAITKVEYNY